MLKRAAASLQNYNYLAAFEKIVFTTIGLLLALWINNWNDDRKKKDTEWQTLLEIKRALEQDRKDIDETITGYEYRFEGAATVLKALDENAPLSQGLLNQFNAINGYSFLLANTGAYETLKSRGLETITNDSLRLAITTLYDVEYDRVQTLDDFAMKVYVSQTLPFLHKHFRQTGRYLEPLDFEKLKKNNEYRELVQYVRYSSGYDVENYQSLQKRVQNLTQQIEQELRK